MTAPGTLAIYAGAALAEILGCFAVWAWMRQGASPLWLLPMAVSTSLPLSSGFGLSRSSVRMLGT